MRARGGLGCALLLLLCIAPAIAGASEERGHEQSRVIVLHGLGRSATSMWLLAERLDDSGFAVHNVDYPSTKEKVDALIERVVRDIADKYNVGINKGKTALIIG